MGQLSMLFPCNRTNLLPKLSTPQHHMLATVLAGLLTGCEVVHAARRRMAQLLGA